MFRPVTWRCEGRTLAKSGTDGLRVALDRRRVTLADGERIDEWRIDQVRQSSKAYGRAWSVVFLEAARALGRTRLSPTASQVLWWALGTLHPRSWTVAGHDRIAEQIGVTRSAATKALLELRRLGLIEAGANSTLRLSPWFCWQGTAQAYQKSRRGRQAALDATRQMFQPDGQKDAGFWRIAADGDEGVGPRERQVRTRTGEEARPVGDFVPYAPPPKARFKGEA